MDGDDGYDDEDNDDDDNEEKPERRRLLRRSAHRRLATRRQVGRGRARGTGEHLDRRGVSGVGKQVGQVSTSSRIAESNADLSLNLIGPDGQNLIVTQQCAAALPLHSFRRAHRQDAAFIAFQAWLIGLAVVAVWSASVPHLVALLVAKILATTFAFVELQLTISFHALFDATINNGACSNTPFVLSNYWSTRAHINIAIATIELVSLLLAAFIAWKLRADLGWRTWKLLGADCQVARVHAVRLAFATTCQLALFFLLCLVAVWVNELVCDDTFYNAQTTADGIVSDLSFPPDSNQAHVFIALLSVLAAAIPIWAYLGISGASRGSRVRLGAWFAIAIVIALSALIMLIDPAHLFSHALDDWAFLLALALISAIVLALAIGLGAVVWLQMGSDAARQDRETSTFIRSRDVLDEDVHGDAPSFDEKAAFEHHEEKIAPDAVVIPFPPTVQRAVFNVPPTRVLFPQHLSVSTMRTFPTTPVMDATPRQSTVAPTSPSAMTNSSDGWLDRLHQPGVLPAAWMPQPTFDSRWSESSLARTAVTDDSVATRHW